MVGRGRLSRVALGVGAAATIAALTLPAREARADDGSIVLVVTGVTLIAATFGWNVAFTAYDASHAANGEEPDFGWMVAQTAVTSPQAALAGVPMVLSQLEGEGQSAAIFGLPLLPASVWGNQMATFAVWSMADQSVDVGSRYGVSWMIAANLTFSTGAIASAFSDCHCTKPWFAIPTLAVTTGETIGSIYQAVNDEDHRAAWIGMSAWSGVLSLHAIGSLIGYAVRSSEDTPQYPYPAPYTPPPRPRPEPPKPRPPLQVPAEDPAAPAGMLRPPELVEAPVEELGTLTPRAPRYRVEISGGGLTAISDGLVTSPGLSLSGRF